MELMDRCNDLAGVANKYELEIKELKAQVAVHTAPKESKSTQTKGLHLDMNHDAMF